METCVKIVMNDRSVEFTADLPSLGENSEKKILEYLDTNPNIDVLVKYNDGSTENIFVNINNYIYENRQKTYLRKLKLTDDVIKNPADYILWNKKYDSPYGFDTSKIHIKEIRSNKFETHYFFSKDNMLMITSGSDTALDQIAYIYNELQSGNTAWADLIISLAPGFSNVYEAFQFIVNSSRGEMYKLISKVNNSNTILEFNGESYELKRKHWYKNGELISDKVIIKKLWNTLINARPLVHPIKDTKIIDIKVKKLMSNGDIFIDKANNKIIYNDGNFLNSEGEIVSDDSIIKGIVSMKNQELFNSLTLEWSLNREMPFTSLRRILDLQLGDISLDDNGNPKYTFGTKTMYSNYSGLLLNRRMLEGDDLSILYIPLLISSYLDDQNEDIKYKLNDIELDRSGIFDIFYKAYVLKEDGATEKMTSLISANNELNKIVDSINNYTQGEIDKDSEIIGSNARDVDDSILKKLIEENIISYCVLNE